MFDSPLITSDKQHYLVILPLNEPKGGSFQQIAMITLNVRLKRSFQTGHII